MKIRQLLTAASVASALATPLSAEIAYNGDWNQTRLFTLTYHLSNFDLTNAEYNFIADNTPIVTIEKTTGQNIYSPTGGAPGHEIASREIAENIRDRNNNIFPLMIYSAGTAYHEIFESTYDRIRSHPGDFFFDSGAQQDYRINVPKSSARNWWVNTVSGNVNSSKLRGFFMDGTRARSPNGSVNFSHGEDMLTRTSGFRLYNGWDVDSEAKILSSHATLDKGDAVWVEDFFRGRMNTGSNNEDRARAVYVLEELARVEAGKTIVTHSAPISSAGLTNNFNYSHRAYLMVANDNSFYDWYTGDSNTTHSFTATNLQRDVGAPLASFSRNRWKFTRCFEHATVWVDVNTRTWGQTWNQNKNTPSTHTVWQAESMTRNGSGSTKSGVNSSGNQYVDLNGGGGLTRTFTYNKGGENLMSFRVKAPSGTRRMGVWINGVKQGVIETTKNAWCSQTLGVVLNHGSNTLEIRDSEGTAEMDIDYMALPKLNTRTVRPLQAEKAEARTGGIVKADRNASQDSYVDGTPGLNLTWYVRAQNTTETINFRVKSPSGTRSLGVYINGSKVGTVTTGSSTWTDKTVTAKLGNGTRKIELRDSEGTNELDVDFMQIVNH